MVFLFHQKFVNLGISEILYYLSSSNDDELTKSLNLTKCFQFPHHSSFVLHSKNSMKFFFLVTHVFYEKDPVLVNCSDFNEKISSFFEEKVSKNGNEWQLDIGIDQS